MWCYFYLPRTLRVHSPCSVGNIVLNRIYEERTIEGFSKPSPTAERDAKAMWITAKYSHKAFVAPNAETAQYDLNSQLFRCALHDRSAGAVMRLLAQGADSEWVEPTSGMTAYQALLAGGACAGDMVSESMPTQVDIVAELFHQNGSTC